VDFNGNKTVQYPKDSFSANCSKSIKQFQMMNKGLIKQNDRSFNKKTTKFKFYKLKCSPCSVLWCAFVTLLFIKMNKSFSVSFGSFN